jgi:hypothetical protein
MAGKSRLIKKFSFAGVVVQRTNHFATIAIKPMDFAHEIRCRKFSQV